MKIETYLPIFTGFYNSVWQFDEENILYNLNEDRENNLSFEDLNINYREYEKDICKNLCNIIEKKLSQYVEKIEYQEIISPKYYNYKNDSINVLITPKIENIQKFIYANQKDFETYLKNRYTSYDGFISFYSNNFKDWESETKNFTKLNINSHYLGSILDFVANTLQIEELDLYYSVMDNICEYDYI